MRDSGEHSISNDERKEVSIENRFVDIATLKVEEGGDSSPPGSLLAPQDLDPPELQLGKLAFLEALALKEAGPCPPPQIGSYETKTIEESSATVSQVESVEVHLKKIH